jgi:hypothetical protein
VVPGTYSIATWSNYRPTEADGCTGVPLQRDKHKLNFTGFCTYYQRFTAGLVDITKLLTQLTEEKLTFQWFPEAEATLKKSCMGSVLGFPWKF